MTHENNTMNENDVTTGLEIAKIVSKDRDGYGAETRKAARGFLKRKRDQRARVLQSFLETIIAAKGMNRASTADEILVAVSGTAESEPAKKPAKRTVKKTPAKRKSTKPGDAPTAKQVRQELSPKPEPKPEPVSNPTLVSTPNDVSVVPQDTATMPSAHTNVAEVSTALAQAEGRHLGDLCGWSISGTRPKAQVDALASKYGLDEDFRFPNLTPNSCYRKAIQQVFNLGKKDHGKAMAVLVEDSSAKIIHSIVTSTVVDDDDDTVSSKDAEFKTEIKVGFNKEAHRSGASPEACLVVEDDSHPAAVALKEKYMELAETYLSYDIRNAFQHAFRLWDACPVLPHGGLWYIPAAYAEKVRAWHGFMTDLGLTTAVIPAFDTSETIESLRQSTRAGLEGQLGDLMYLMDMYAREGWDKVRTSTLEKRVEEFDELRARAELYQSILGTTIGDLAAKVERCAERLTNDVSKRHEAEASEQEAKAKAKAEAKEAKKAEREAAKKAKAEAKAAEKKAAKKQGRKAKATSAA